MKKTITWRESVADAIEFLRGVPKGHQIVMQAEVAMNIARALHVMSGKLDERGIGFDPEFLSRKRGAVTPWTRTPTHAEPRRMQ